MREFGIKHIRCTRCRGRLEVESLHETLEIDEGFLTCGKCGMMFPIIGKIAILRDFVNYVSNRPHLGGDLLLAAKSPKMRSFVKGAMAKVGKNPNDLSIIEKRWAQIYEKNKGSKFYSTMKNHLDSLPVFDTAVEHGCSVGIMGRHLAENASHVFGIDKSYHALSIAKKAPHENLDFFVADSLEHPFGNAKFDLALGLNMFELVEPRLLLKVLADQVRKGGFVAISDPYDFERGAKSVKEPLRDDSTRRAIEQLGFRVTSKTKKPSYIPWHLRLYERASLNYKVDLIIGKKTIA